MPPVKRITLLRHAEAAAGDATTPDRDRQLTDRGRSDAPLIGRRLRSTGARPSLLLTSPARRTLQTAQLIARELDYPLEFLQRERELYLASPEGILHVLASQDNAFNDVLVCGHNPGLTDLLNQLTGAGISDVPTCGFAVIEAPIREWTELTRARLVTFDFPGNPGTGQPGA